jgi:hypothetical protein
VARLVRNQLEEDEAKLAGFEGAPPPTATTFVAPTGAPRTAAERTARSEWATWTERPAGTERSSRSEPHCKQARYHLELVSAAHFPELHTHCESPPDASEIYLPVYHVNNTDAARERWIGL